MWPDHVTATGRHFTICYGYPRSFSRHLLTLGPLYGKQQLYYFPAQPTAAIASVFSRWLSPPTALWPHAAKAWQTTVVRLLLGLFLLPPVHIIIRLAAAVAATRRQLLICEKIKRHCVRDVRSNVLERAPVPAPCVVWPRTIISGDRLSYNSFYTTGGVNECEIAIWVDAVLLCVGDSVYSWGRERKLINRSCSREECVSQSPDITPCLTIHSINRQNCSWRSPAIACFPSPYASKDPRVLPIQQ
jgi:hypothetical protein